MNIFGTIDEFTLSIKIQYINLKKEIMNRTSHVLLIPAIALMTLAGCKSKKTTPVQKDTGAVEITVPFSSKEYRSDENAFGAKQVGKSPDIATAKKIAFQNARAEMASNINATVKR